MCCFAFQEKEWILWKNAEGGGRRVMHIRLRKGCPADIYKLSTLLSGLFSLETDFAVDPDKQKAGLALFLDGREDKAIFVAEEDGVIIGMVTCQLVVSTAAGGFSILLEDMYVLDAYRRKYVGTGLIRLARNWGINQDALRIQLVADERNKPAQLFYKKLGFKESHMTGFYMPLSDEK
jgi:GNAT superfamily N-acetyltransferase